MTVVRGEVGDRFATAFGGMTVRTSEGVTHLVGEVIDQRHLRQILNRIDNLGLQLISVERLAEEPGGAPPS